MNCRICGGNCSKRVELNGTMYGSKGQYWYTICDDCGCLQIEEIPQNLSEYYDENEYYSLNMDKRKLKNKLLFLQMKNQVVSKNIFGAVTQFLYPVDYSCFKRVNKDSEILDVGCGDGELLRWLVELGYTRVSGIDPYARNYEGKYTIISSDIRYYNPGKRFDLITLFHVLEHLDDQICIVSKACELLNENGYIALMIPFFSRYYWDKYKATLYTLDPPRHLYIHTKKSVMKLFEGTGMKLVYFSTETDPGIPEMAGNVKGGHSEMNGGSSFIKGSIISVCTKGLRRKLKKAEDGAIATFIFQKKAVI